MIRSLPLALLAALTAAAPFGTTVITTLAADGAAAQGQSSGRRGTDLPLPRFVSLKSGNVNVRRGPGQEYDLSFTFVRAGLPVEIVQEFDNWRKIRDADGSEGWVFHSLLSGQRTAVVAPWEKAGQFPAHSQADGAGPVVAYLQPRVVAQIEECTGTWCLLKGENYEGWIEQNRLWGVYPEEQFAE